MSDLTITGLGVFLNQLAPEAKASIDCAAFVVFQTRRHPFLRTAGDGQAAMIFTIPARISTN